MEEINDLVLLSLKKTNVLLDSIKMQSVKWFAIVYTNRIGILIYICLVFNDSNVEPIKIRILWKTVTR